MLLLLEKLLQMILERLACLDTKASRERIQGCIGVHAGCVNIEFFAPDQSCLLALLDHHVKEAAEDR